MKRFDLCKRSDIVSLIAVILFDVLIGTPNAVVIIFQTSLNMANSSIKDPTMHEDSQKQNKTTAKGRE